MYSEPKRGKKKIQTNLDRISEIDAYIKSIKESEEADFKIFSPRSSESIYGDRIRKAEEEKEEIEMIIEIIIKNKSDR